MKKSKCITFIREKGLFSGRPSMASARQPIRGREPLKETLFSNEGDVFTSNTKPQNSNRKSVTEILIGWMGN